jgi:hypothetical protein
MSSITHERNPFRWQKILASLDHIQLDHCVVPPMNRLPIELVTKIFIHCLPDKPVSPDRHRAPLLLGQICKHWRTMALAMPLLWRTIRARISSDPDILERQVAWIELWLLRSSECPLVINLHLLSRSHSHQVLDVVICHAHRWQDVSLHLTLSSLRHLAPIQGRLFELRRLCLQSPKLWHLYATGWEMPFEPICTFKAAPNLREVDISFGSVRFDLPWTQLIRARFGCHVPDCAEHIRRAPNLVQCTLGGCWMNSDVGVPDRIVVSQIVTLHLEETYQSGVETIFQYVTLPVLRDLSISFRDGTVWPHSSYVTFLLRSRCRIERLALIGATMAYQELISLLQGLPSIVELHILWVDTTVAEGYQPIVDDNFLRLLTCNESLDTPVLLPKLQAIMLWGSLRFDDQSLVNMIQTRLLKPPPGVACFAYVGLYYHREWDEGAIKRLESFQASGLELLVEKVPIEKQQYCPEWDGFQLCVSV